MSRSEAKRRITMEEHFAATSGVECRKDAAVIDESPRAYKDIDAVMSATVVPGPSAALPMTTGIATR